MSRGCKTICSVLSAWILGRNTKQLFSLEHKNAQSWEQPCGVSLGTLGVGHKGSHSSQHTRQAGTEQPQLANSCILFSLSPSPCPHLAAIDHGDAASGRPVRPARLPLTRQLQKQPKNTLPNCSGDKIPDSPDTPQPMDVPSWLLPDFLLPVPTSSSSFPGRRGHTPANEEIHKLIKLLPLRARSRIRSLLVLLFLNAREVPGYCSSGGTCIPPFP